MGYTVFQTNDGQSILVFVVDERRLDGTTLLWRCRPDGDNGFDEAGSTPARWGAEVETEIADSRSTFVFAPN